jgi:hypothetical protein
MLYENCSECKHYYECYTPINMNDKVIPSVGKALIALRKRDLCVNNDKVDWESWKS